MDPREIRAFVDRDWARVADAKAEYWANRKRLLGTAEGIRVGEDLRAQAALMHPGWPDESDRQLDLDAHAALSLRMRRVDANRRR